MAGLIQSFINAFRGIRYVLRSERNARIHLLLALGVLAAAGILGVDPRDMAALVLAILIVFLAEITNTAFEKTLDLVDNQVNERVKIVKDMAAGGVLVAAMIATIIGAVVFKPYVQSVLWAVH